MLVLFYHTFRVLSFFPLHVTLLCKEANIMYEQNENPWGTNEAPRPPQPGGNMLATAALICSILAIVSSCCLYGAFVFGGLAIILGLLSRGAKKSAQSPARTAIWLGIAAVILSAVITTASLVSAIRQFGSFQKLLDSYTYTIEKYLDLDPDAEPGADDFL